MDIGSFFRSPAFLFVLAVLWMLLGTVHNWLLEKIKSLTKGTQRGLEKWRDEIKSLTTDTQASQKAWQGYAKRRLQGRDKVLDKWAKGLRGVQDALVKGGDHLKSVLAPSPHQLGARLLGLVVCLAAALVFLYADLVRAYGVQPHIYGAVEAPEWLANLAASYVVSSVGSAAFLGIVLADLLLAGNHAIMMWSQAKGVFRVLLVGIVAVAWLMAVAFSVSVQLLNWPLIAQVAPELDQGIRWVAGLGHSGGVWFPMLISTALAGWCVYILLVPPMILAYALSLPFRLWAFQTESLQISITSLASVNAEQTLHFRMGVLRLLMKAVAGSISVAAGASGLFGNFLYLLVALLLRLPKVVFSLIENKLSGEEVTKVFVDLELSGDTDLSFHQPAPHEIQSWLDESFYFSVPGSPGDSGDGRTPDT